METQGGLRGCPLMLFPAPHRSLLHSCAKYVLSTCLLLHAVLSLRDNISEQTARGPSPDRQQVNYLLHQTVTGAVEERRGRARAGAPGVPAGDKSESRLDEATREREQTVPKAWRQEPVG